MASRQLLDANDAYWVNMFGDPSPISISIEIMYMNDLRIYAFSHIMRLENNTQYVLPRHSVNVDEISNRLMYLHDGYCRFSAGVPHGKLILCTKGSPDHLMARQTPLEILFSLSVITRPLKRGLVRKEYRSSVYLTREDLKIGTIYRPRICIIPALILCFSLFSVAAFVRYRQGIQDLAFKQ